MTENRLWRRTSENLRDGLVVSLTSFAWTIAAGTGAVTIGVIGNSLVLVAFGAIGLLDAIGSGSLIVHFRPSRRHEAVSERHERLALIIVTSGMAAVGIATLADSGYRLATRATSAPPPAGIALAGISVFVLVILAVRKREIARRIPSHALHADGWLSLMGAVLALVALIGTALDTALGWRWTDPIAAIAVACGAIGLSIALARGPDIGSVSGR